MAEKGARAELEAVVRQTYIETGNLTLAAETHGVSRQSAAEWKRRAGDEWDKARERKGDHYQRMQLLFDRQMAWVEDQPPHMVTPPMVDALSKLGALVEKTEKIVAAARKQALEEARNQAANAVDSATGGGSKKLTAEEFKKILKESYGA